MGRDGPSAASVPDDPAAPPSVRPGVACDLCGSAVAGDHAHLVEVETRRLRCACRRCARLFERLSEGARYRAVSDRILPLGDSVVSAEAWEGLRIPAGIAFFFRHSPFGGVVGFYPGAAGAMESLPSLGAWDAFRRRTPVVDSIAPDVEALLVRRLADGRLRACIAPIDRCYELVGRIRRSWRGADGGDEARAEIDRFFEALDTPGDVPAARTS